MYFNDPYEYYSVENVMYIVENIPTNETEQYFEEIFQEGCKCENECTLEKNCLCIKKYGLNYIFEDFKIVKDIHAKYTLSNNKISNGLYECNANCNCKNKTCGNRLVQFGPRNNLEVRSCGEKGLGLFTTQKILRGNFVCEYAGEVISKSEAMKRFKYNQENDKMNYIICIQEYFGDKLNSTFIDPAYFGNIGRYLNHSCNPNCILNPVRTDYTVPKICIFAKKDIDENSELTFDYGDGKMNKISDNEVELKHCFCNESICRKWMPYNVNIGK